MDGARRSSHVRTKKAPHEPSSRGGQHPSDDPGDMTGEELVPFNVVLFYSVVRPRPARSIDTEGTLEGRPPNADAVWTTRKKDSAGGASADLRSCGAACCGAGDDGERLLAGNTGVGAARQKAE